MASVQELKDKYETEYKKLNTLQRQAVDTIDGPVMVVAGPGTGKTQILALRIANILQKTDIKADGILCLTFTNSAVEAMKERLVRYIGEAGNAVHVSTFHGFGMKIIEAHFKVLGLDSPPALLEDAETVIFFDQILNGNDWAYLRPRGDSARYFKDLRSLVSLLKRERISSKDFSQAIEKEIEFLKGSEGSISTRGESKGELKKEVIKQIEGLEKSLEIGKFLDIYDKTKKEKNVLDYDDVLENLVRIMETSPDALATVREKYLYILIDEHQDSSRVQNAFLKVAWGDVERPDIFVVGDDRQLIYGFSGASIDHFKGFQKTFREAKLIALLDNYRSTQVILDAAHALLKSVLSPAKLISQSRDSHPIRLIEGRTAEEEIIAAGLDIREKEINPGECAILVPKNAQVRRALEILHSLGLPVASLEALNLFDQEEYGALLRVLKIIASEDSRDASSLALSFFDKTSHVSPLEAHTFLAGENMRQFSFELLLEDKPQSLFAESPTTGWIKKLSKWKSELEKNDLRSLLQTIGKELFERREDKTEDKKLVGGDEILNTILSLLDKELEKHPELGLNGFISYLEKLELYGEEIPLVAAPTKGIKVLTMHSSKGLEFEYVWIAHMDERSLSGGRRMGFTLPEGIREKIEERDVDAIKRKLYVAITRAKKFCTLSYSAESNKGGERELANIIAELPKEVFERHTAHSTHHIAKTAADLSKLKNLVSKKYTDRYVSVSLLNNFFECPWKWYFNNLLGLPQPKNENLEFGSAIHNAIDRILKLGRMPSEQDIDDLMLSKEALQIIKKWIESRLPNIKNYKNEQSVSVKDERFPHLNLYGKIDLIENLSGDAVRVTDFKTGGVRKKSDIEKLDDEERMSGNLRQLAMYSYLIKQSPKWQAEVRESRLEFLEAKNEKDIFYDTLINADQIDMLIKDIKDYDELVKSGKWLERECHYNSYGKNTECEYCKMAEIYQ